MRSRRVSASPEDFHSASASTVVALWNVVVINHSDASSRSTAIAMRSKSIAGSSEAGRDHRDGRIDGLEHEFPSAYEVRSDLEQPGKLHADRPEDLHTQLSVEQ